MADFDNRIVRGATTVADTMDAGLRAHMLRVYNYMLAGLGLTGAVASLAREAACDGVTINNLLPGYFDTDRLAGVFAAQARRQNVSPDELRARAEAGNPTRRVGRPEEFGAACAFLASTHAGFINGQNLLMDGGAFPGVF